MDFVPVVYGVAERQQRGFNLSSHYPGLNSCRAVVPVRNHGGHSRVLRGQAPRQGQQPPHRTPGVLRRHSPNPSKRHGAENVRDRCDEGYEARFSSGLSGGLR